MNLSKAIRVLRRRQQFLEDRASASHRPLTFDEGEIAALAVALRLMEREIENDLASSRIVRLAAERRERND